MRKHLRGLLLTALTAAAALLMNGISASAVTIVPDSARQIGDHYYKVYADLPTDTLDVEQKAQQLCKKRGGHLACIEDMEENDAVWDMLNNEGIDYKVYLEIEPIFAETQGFSVVYDDDGRAFNDYSLYNMHNGFVYVCEWDKGGKSSSYSTDYGESKIPDATEEFGGNQYKLFPNGLTHSDAAIFCRSIGGHLVSIGSEEEAEFVYGLIKADDSGRSMYWIGTQYYGTDGAWFEPDGEQTEFFDWSSSEPNNYMNGANFTVINRDAASYDEFKWVAEFDNGVLNDDVRELSAYYGFICEWEPVCGGVKYFHGSTENIVTQEANCITEGELSTVCSDCGEVLHTTSIAVEPHSYRSTPLIFKGLKIPGLQILECSVCGDRDYVVTWSKVWFLPAFLLLTLVTIVSFISAYADYRSDYGYGAPPVWALLMAFALIAGAAAIVYLLFIR